MNSSIEQIMKFSDTLCENKLTNGLSIFKSIKPVMKEFIQSSSKVNQKQERYHTDTLVFVVWRGICLWLLRRMTYQPNIIGIILGIQNIFKESKT